MMIKLGVDPLPAEGAALVDPPVLPQVIAKVLKADNPAVALWTVYRPDHVVGGNLVFLVLFRVIRWTFFLFLILF